MKKSKINFIVELDDKNIPEKIEWAASDKSDDKLTETKSISISLWDHIQRNTMRIDLWTKEMPVDEMKRFYIDCVGGIGQSVLNATGDEKFSQIINETCNKLVDHLEEEMKKQ